jgi:hypothetical protein
MEFHCVAGEPRAGLLQRPTGPLVRGFGRYRQGSSWSNRSGDRCNTSIREVCAPNCRGPRLQRRLAAEERARHGSCSAVSTSPRSSFRMSIRSASHSITSDTMSTSASVPMETPGYPRSRRAMELGWGLEQTTRSATAILDLPLSSGEVLSLIYAS